MQDIIQKFRFKGDPVVINAPASFHTGFNEAVFKSSFDKKVKSSNSLIFINNKNELMLFF